MRSIKYKFYKKEIWVETQIWIRHFPSMAFLNPVDLEKIVTVVDYFCMCVMIYLQS